ncbi:MAG: sensor histidine kinase, partial [Alphaproteobacteria bacterium]
MLDDSRLLAETQMSHLLDEVKASLQDGNYQSVDRFLNNWGKNFPDVASVKLMARNGSVISQFSRDISGENFINFERKIDYSYKGQARLILIKGLRSVDREMEKFLWQLIFISLVALVVLTVLVNEILHRRQMEREIRLNNDELEENIDKRTAQLRHEVEERKTVEKNLLIAKDAAENATRAKSEFLANMSHELRTPLNAILGYSEAISMETFGPINNEKYAEYLRIIHNSGDHLLGLINEVLDISAIEAGKLELKEENIDVVASIDAMIALLEPKARKKQLQVSYEDRRELPPLFGDERRIKQVILNLLSNAIRYTLEKGRIEVRADIDESNAIWISISDTGIGMSEADIVTALETFGRVHNYQIQENSGTGLGLPLVKSLVELHGGSLRIESTPAVGTTVTVRFPARRSIYAA